MSNFVHLHVHTEFSLLDGASRLEELVCHCEELGMESLAITDHGVMYGVVEFFKLAKKHGIKPIIGCEVYVAARTMHDRDPRLDNSSYHLVLLAKNEKGYGNLIKLVSAGFVDGFYYKPRVDIALLRKHSEGLICLSACLAGEIPQKLLKNDYEGAKEIALEYEKIFGKGNYYIEIQDHGIEEQRQTNPQLIRLARETGIGLIATNDVHYTKKMDAAAQDVLLCIQTATNVDDENRMRFEGDEFYLKSPKEMAELFVYVPEAIENAEKIAAMCDFEFEFGNIKLPKFDVPEGFDSNSYLRHLTMESLNQKYPQLTEAIENRVDYELATITNMGYADYYLIVWDYVRFAKEHDIVVGPGRGSGAGSIVAYLVGITNIDPIKYNLVFERFLNPERISMPDFDVDFCYERRQEVIDYVIEKYGKERVAQIVTFGTMAARGAIRDVGRALNMTYAEVDVIAKLVPFELKMTIEKALKISAELKMAYDSDPRVKKLLNTAMALEGMPRHTSTHAAGVVISKRAVSDYVPLQTNDNVVTTQFTMGNLEELGLLKMDFLGLRTLTVIRDALDLIRGTTGIDMKNLDRIDDADQNVYKLISSGDTYGIFQLESGGMTNFMKELRATSIEDVIAGISLYRPGPMNHIPRYLKNKHNPELITYLHPSLEPILNVTYGVIIYQEQVMQIVRDLAGYSMGRSDLVRRAMSKKKKDVMDQERKNFIHGIVDADGTIVVPGCVRNGIPAATAEKIYDELISFAEYGFNKAHAACYAIVGYQTAWLKYYYPVEFTAALITSIMDNLSKVAEYIQEAKKDGIEILPPDINESVKKFSVTDGRIRFGLAAVKNVGEGAIDAMIEERDANGPFLSLQDFLNRVDLVRLNKRTVESLIRCGAFDGFGTYRSQMIATYEKMMDSVNARNKNNIKGQLSLFELVEEDVVTGMEVYPEIKEFSKRDLLTMEKEMLGLYVSGHPLEEYRETLAKKSSIKTSDFNVDEEDPAAFQTFLKRDGEKATLGGIMTNVKRKTTRNNAQMAFVQLEDFYGTMEVIIFPRDYVRLASILKEDEIVLVQGRLSIKEDDSTKLIAADIKLLTEEPGNDLNKTLYLKIEAERRDELWDEVRQILGCHRGENPVCVVEIDQSGKRNIFKVSPNFYVTINHALTDALGMVVGRENVALK